MAQRERDKRRTEARRVAKYGPSASGVDMRGRHGHVLRGPDNPRWSGGIPKSERVKAARARAVAKGLCSHCYARPTVPPRRKCPVCLERNRIAARARYRPAHKRRHDRCLARRRARWAGLSDAVCRRCRRRPMVVGKRSCAVCLERMRLAANAAYACRLGPRANAKPPALISRAPTVMTHVAGYVPPKGSIAWMLLGRVYPPTFIGAQ